MNALDYLKTGKFNIWKDTFSVVKAKRVPDIDAVMVLKDKNEITIIANAQLVEKEWVIKEEKNWAIMTFEGKLPFELTGFLAIITQALAEEKIPVYVVSSFSTDHILIKKEYLIESVKKLESMGCRFSLEERKGVKDVKPYLLMRDIANYFNKK